MKKLIAMLVLVGFTSVLTVSAYAQDKAPQDQGKDKDKGEHKGEHHHHHHHGKGEHKGDKK
jgi:hypothetical protein